MWDGTEKVKGLGLRVKGWCFVVFQAEHRTMAVFILAIIVNSYTTGQVCVRVCLCVSVCVCAVSCARLREDPELLS